MTNEEIIENIHTGFYTIHEALNSARKDEAIAFGDFLKKYNPIDHTRGKTMWWDKRIGGYYYSTEQLYKLFKKEK